MPLLFCAEQREVLCCSERKSGRDNALNGGVLGAAQIELKTG